MPAPDDDYALVQRCLRGEMNAFQGLVEKYQQPIFLLITGIILDREQAKDLTQIVFIKAYRSLSKFKGRSRFYTWLYRIAFNLALDAKRKKSGKEMVEYDDNLVVDRAPDKSRPDRKIIREELYELIRQGLEMLTISQRTTILLREWEGCSYQEISTIMNCSRGTVMSRLYYARVKLRESLKPYLA
jgi:RNA polymerase sigma-70 factor (ECF subfamily)